MLDVQLLRADPGAFDHALARRGVPRAAERLLALDTTLRAAVGALETLQAARKKGPIDKAALQEAVAAEAAARGAWNTAWLLVPNTPLAEVPNGADETGNVEIHRWAPTGKAMDAPGALEHHHVAGVAALLDAETGAKLAGPRQTVLHGPLARLHRALAQWMLDLHVDTHGLSEAWVPVLAKGDALRGTGHLPKFAEDAYQIQDQDNWLIPTAEVPLTYMAGHTIHEAAALPVRLVAHSGCFRAEAGAGGRDGAGLLRRHQFEKVEMVTWCTPEQAEAEHARMLEQAKAVLEGLELPYRVVVLCTGDMGFASEMTYDIEVWMPGQRTYREIASISRCGAFQARRMAARYRPTPGAKPAFLHTLNGSGVAVGRALAAVVENNQRADGGVDIPKALQSYCGGHRAIAPDGTWA
jgi:seryl-tRNA synthetase